MTTKRHITIIVLVMLLGFFNLGVIANADKPDARALIAALNFNFAKYANWPTQVAEGEHVELCYFSDSLKQSFEALNNKSIYDKSVVVNQLSKIEQAHACHLVFIEKSERQLVQRLLVHLENRPVLTVSDVAGFSDKGGMIEIITVDNKFRFKVNRGQLNKADLKMSAQVLKLAVDVK
jgi:hypothetical protein